MTRIRRTALLVVIASVSFGTAFGARMWTSEPNVVRTTPPPAFDAPDSVKLAAMGINPGRQLVVYLLVASRCSHCQRPETKTAIKALRARLRESNIGAFRTVKLVGVAIDADIREGLDYLSAVGWDSFDEISVGNAWLNEHVAWWAWRERVAEASVPQVIIVERDIDAAIRPFAVQYGADSVLAVLGGRRALVEWARRGATIEAAEELAARSKVEADSLAKLASNQDDLRR